MTTALALARQRIKAMIEQYGGAPERVALTRYDTAESFARQHPGEDYVEYLVQRAELVDWLTEMQIAVDDVLAPADRALPLPKLAEKAAYRGKGQPYRLGLNVFGAPRGSGGSAAGVGWMTVMLGRTESGEDR